MDPTPMPSQIAEFAARNPVAKPLLRQHVDPTAERFERIERQRGALGYGNQTEALKLVSAEQMSQFIQHLDRWLAQRSRAGDLSRLKSVLVQLPTAKLAAAVINHISSAISMALRKKNATHTYVEAIVGDALERELEMHGLPKTTAQGADAAAAGRRGVRLAAALAMAP
jgi:hypothetical protein